MIQSIRVTRLVLDAWPRGRPPRDVRNVTYDLSKPGRRNARVGGDHVETIGYDQRGIGRRPGPSSGIAKGSSSNRRAMRGYRGMGSDSCREIRRLAIETRNQRTTARNHRGSSPYLRMSNA